MVTLYNRKQSSEQHDARRERVIYYAAVSCLQGFDNVNINSRVLDSLQNMLQFSKVHGHEAQTSLQAVRRRLAT